MSNSRPLSSDKTENIGTTIGFRFHANDEELEELSAPESISAANCKENVKSTADSSTPEFLDCSKDMGDGTGAVSDSVKEHRNLLGKRSISVDSAYESLFSNPIEKWKKLNVLKERITKTVEEKICEMKIDSNVLSKTSRNTLNHSKESSSISDSEDTSESSKMSDQWKNAENQALDSNKTSNENLEIHSSTLETPIQDVKYVKYENDNKECENELRNRIAFTNFVALINLPEIKVATAKTDTEDSLFDVSLTEEIESGVEADENLEAGEDSLDFDGMTLTTQEGGSSPPFRGNSFYVNALYSLKSVIISQSITIVVIFGLTVYFFFPLSEFIRGFLLSFLLITFWGTVKTYIQLDESSQHQGPFIIPNYNSMPPLEVPQSKSAKGIWFNEYEQEVYDPDFYSVSQTVPAFLELEDNILKVSRPKGKIQRRATYDEPEYKLPIINQRIYNISGCNVYLMPDGLTRKRLFSKKYPIVIFLKPDSLIFEKKSGKETDEKAVQEEAKSEDQPTVINPESPKNKSTLYLFARCDRQKEEWYRRLLSASRYCQKNENENEATESTNKETEKTPIDGSPSKEPCTPFENLFFDDDVAVKEEYMHYMANFVHLEILNPDDEVSNFPVFRKHKLKKKDVPSEEANKKRPNVKTQFNSIPVSRKTKCNRNSVNEGKEEMEKEKSFGSQIQWFNAFLNRILFDVFRSPYWHSKIQEKVHRKLNSIRLPYYIEDIEVIELDLGKTGPMFHRVSEPVIDERGLWFDMDLTFDGLIRLTIQTHLNLIKLQKGMEDTEEVAAQGTEKPRKGKKSQKTEKEPKDAFLIKESKEKIENSINPKTKTLKKVSTNIPDVEQEERVLGSPQLNDGPSLENPLSRRERSKLFDEVAKFAEIIVEESVQQIKEKESKVNADVPRSEASKSRSAIYDSELEDSAESSDEDEEEEDAPHPEPPLVTEESPSAPTSKRYPKNRRSSKRIFKVFENVAQSKYFRSMAQSKYIQKAIAGVSAAKLRLTLEIKSCTGILTINIPPPPSDRFWYGFREMPKLVFSANPKIGDKPVRFVHIRNYLQKKILHELKSKIVRPNMIGNICPMLVREQLTPTFINVPRKPKAFESDGPAEHD